MPTLLQFILVDRLQHDASNPLLHLTIVKLAHIDLPRKPHVMSVMSDDDSTIEFSCDITREFS